MNKKSWFHTFTWRHLGLLLLLCLAVGQMGATQAQGPDEATAAPARGGDILDGSVRLNYAFGAASTITAFEVPLGTNHLVDGWWWYRVSGDAAETRLPAPDNQTYAGSSATFTWNDVDGRGFDLSLMTTVRDTAGDTGTAGTALTRVTVTNPGGTPLALELFYYTNVNLAGTSPSDSASLITANNHILVQEGATTAELFGLGAGAYEVALAPVIKDALADGGVTDLSNSGLPFGPNDFSSAFQWSLNVPAGASSSIGACVAVNHSCAGASITVTLDNEPDNPSDAIMTVDGPNPDPTYTHQWGGKGSGPGELDNPTGVVVDGAGRVYVSDSQNNRIQIFSATGRPLDSWGSTGPEPGNFQFPNGLTFDEANDWIYVADSDNDRVQKFDLNGTVLLAWGVEGSGTGQFQFPADVAVDGAGLVYVADSSNHRIQVFDSSGVFQFAFGEVGTGNGEFISPRGVAVDGQGRIFVADTFNNRVQRFSPSGQFETTWGSSGSGTGQFDAPLDIAIDSMGRPFVTDLGNDRVQVFNGDGTFLFTWGTLGKGDGQFVNISGIGLDGANNSYVSDPYAPLARVQRFASAGFPLDDVDDGDDVGATQTLYGLPAGAWDITALLPLGWDVTAIACASNDPADSSGVDLGGSTAQLDVDLGEHLYCTFSGAIPYQIQLPVVIQDGP